MVVFIIWHFALFSMSSGKVGQGQGLKASYFKCLLINSCDASTNWIFLFIYFCISSLRSDCLLSNKHCWGAQRISWHWHLEKEKTMNWNQKWPFPLMKGICYVVGAWLYDQPKVIQSHQKNSRSHTEKFLLPWMLKVQVYSEVAIAIGVKRYSSYGHLKPLANVRSCRKSGRSYSVFVIVIVIVIVIVRGWAKSSQEHLEWSALSQETMICMYWSFLLSLILLLSSGWRGTPQLCRALEASS